MDGLPGGYYSDHASSHTREESGAGTGKGGGGGSGDPDRSSSILQIMSSSSSQQNELRGKGGPPHQTDGHHHHHGVITRISDDNETTTRGAAGGGGGPRDRPPPTTSSSSSNNNILCNNILLTTTSSSTASSSSSNNNSDTQSVDASRVLSPSIKRCLSHPGADGHPPPPVVVVAAAHPADTSSRGGSRGNKGQHQHEEHVIESSLKFDTPVGDADIMMSCDTDGHCHVVSRNSRGGLIRRGHQHQTGGGGHHDDDDSDDDQHDEQEDQQEQVLKRPLIKRRRNLQNFTSSPNVLSDSHETFMSSGGGGGDHGAPGVSGLHGGRPLEPPLGDPSGSSFDAPPPNPLTERFRRRLKYHFMNPIDKWRAKGKLPWKLGLQVIKIIVVTLQLLIFGLNMSKYLLHQGNLVVTFRELFMEGWDPVREVMTYPPAAGPYAVYTKDDFYGHMNKAIGVYSSITTDAIGSFGYGPVNVSSENPMSPIGFCKEFYAVGHSDPSRFFFNYTNVIVTQCIEVANGSLMPGDPEWHSFSIEEYLAQKNFSLVFDRLLKVTLSFPIRTVYLNSLDPSEEPDCYDVEIVITYDHSQRDGQMVIHLESLNHKRRCSGNIDHGTDYRRTYEQNALNVLVIALCSVSLLLCVRSLWRGNQLRQKSVQFFRRNFGKDLSAGDQMNFLDLWIVMMAANDLLIIGGSIMKLMWERHWGSSSRSEMDLDFSGTSLLLGVGNLLVWMGLLRYLSFFRQYNVLILTLKRALPHVLRFMLCTLLLYGGFCFCGWLVLGPYHMKFRELSTTSECLFSLLNGDDMFATFAVLDPKGQNVIWWFSRVYLYSFICLFIYVVISLFISIIMDSYETIKEYHEQGFPLTDLQRFIAECSDEASSSIYLSEEPLVDSIDDRHQDHDHHGSTAGPVGGRSSSSSSLLRNIWSKIRWGIRVAPPAPLNNPPPHNRSQYQAI